MPERDQKADTSGLPPSAERMIRQVGEKQERIARSKGSENEWWRSIESLGVVGWSVTLPTLLGVAVGVWLDRHWPSRFSWTLILLSAGLIGGCASAWFHIRGQRR